MLVVSLKDEAGPFLNSLRKGVKGEAASVLRSVSNEMKKRYATYARTASLGPYAPLTVALRKQFKGGYGQWIGRFARYQVDPNTLTAKIGVLSKSDVLGMGPLRFVPISAGFSKSAQLHASGWTKTITRAKQKSIAKGIMLVYGKGGNWGDVEYLIRKLMPRLGSRPVRPRPIAEPVYEANRTFMVNSFETLFDIKRAGERYSKDWAAQITN